MLWKSRFLLVLATLVFAFGFGLSSSAQAEDAASFIKEFEGAKSDDGWTSASTRAKGGDNVAVPEPGTIALIGLGLTSLGVLRRRKS